jgi:hypothetical protein
MLQENPDTLFVFGDNMAEKGLGGQAKEMRGEPNAVGIPTKNYPGMGEFDFFEDGDFDRAKIRIDAAFAFLVTNKTINNREIVWPADGIGTGLADLENKAPKIWALIERYRLALDQLD